MLYYLVMREWNFVIGNKRDLSEGYFNKNKLDIRYKEVIVYFYLYLEVKIVIVCLE